MTITLLLPAIVALVGTLVYFLVGPTDPRGIRQWALCLVLAGLIGVCTHEHWGDVDARPALHERR